ncbi:MAG: HMA2 domain-containing protein [Nitrospirales bacterium]
MENKKNIQVVHALPDRVRLKLHQLKNNMAYAAEIQRQLHAVPGITHLEANPKTGSLLIHYDPTVLEVLSLHPSVSSCLGLPPSDVKQLKKDTSPAKGRVKTLKTVRKAGTKIKGKAKSDKSSKKARGKS